MKSQPLPLPSRRPRVVLFVALAAALAGCGHEFTLKLLGRAGDACDIARPMACDFDRAHLLVCRPQAGSAPTGPHSGIPGVWEVRCRCIDECVVEMASDNAGPGPAEVVIEVRCQCPTET